MGRAGLHMVVVGGGNVVGGWRLHWYHRTSRVRVGGGVGFRGLGRRRSP